MDSKRYQYLKFFKGYDLSSGRKQSQQRGNSWDSELMEIKQCLSSQRETGQKPISLSEFLEIQLGTVR
jgi:hypothetical protein